MIVSVVIATINVPTGARLYESTEHRMIFVAQIDAPRFEREGHFGTRVGHVDLFEQVEVKPRRVCDETSKILAEPIGPHKSIRCRVRWFFANITPYGKIVDFGQDDLTVVEVDLAVRVDVTRVHFQLVACVQTPHEVASFRVRTFDEASIPLLFFAIFFWEPTQ